MTIPNDYTQTGDADNPTYSVWATRDQIGRVFKALFGSDYGVSGSGKMSRLDFARAICNIQGRDTNPNYQDAVAAGMTLARFADGDFPVVVEVSNSHDYVKDSSGHETWVYNEAY